MKVFVAGLKLAGSCVASMFLYTTQAVSNMSGSSYFESLRDVRKLAVQLLSYWVLLPELVQNFILSEISNFNMVNNLSKSVYALPMRTLTFQ